MGNEPIKLPRIDDLDPRDLHVCQFTIPVEWQYMYYSRNEGNISTKEFPSPTRKRVTKLRCVCGQETTR